MERRDNDVRNGGRPAEVSGTGAAEVSGTGAADVSRTGAAEGRGTGEVSAQCYTDGGMVKHRLNGQWEQAGQMSLG